MKEDITESLAFFNDLLDLSNTNEIAKSGIWCVPALVLELPCAEAMLSCSRYDLAEKT
jgi:hypothetical protein